MSLLEYGGIVFVVALAGGCVPLLVRWTDRLLHAVLALSTGIFLGAVFLHLLPELSRLENAAGAADAAGAAHAHDHVSLWLFVLIGVVAVYLLEVLAFRIENHDDVHRHTSVGYAALLGLSIHSLTGGMGLAVTAQDPALARVLFLSIVAHKAAETFSMSTVFQLAQFTRRRSLVLLVLLAAATPAGILAGYLVQGQVGAEGTGILTALAAGTFLYVCLCELLPEVFHRREDGPMKILLLVAGVAVMLAVEVGA